MRRKSKRLLSKKERRQLRKAAIAISIIYGVIIAGAVSTTAAIAGVNALVRKTNKSEEEDILEDAAASLDKDEQKAIKVIANT
jgi:hypothetical protein